VKWTEAPLKGVWVLEQERRGDERGNAHAGHVKRSHVTTALT